MQFCFKSCWIILLFLKIEKDCAMHRANQPFLIYRLICISLQQKFPCDICSKVYAYEHQLREHKLSHGKRSWRCNVCGHSCFTKAKLDAHVNIKHGNNPNYGVECRFCHKVMIRDIYINISPHCTLI